MITEKLLGQRYRFKEDHIPSWLTESQKEAREVFLKELFKEENFTPVKKCPYCGADEFIKISEVDGKGLPSEVVICKLCNGCFKSLALKPEATKYHYSHISYQLRGKEITDDKMEELFRKRVGMFAYNRYYFISHFLELNQKDDLIVELGCNDGANLYPYYEDGFEVLGIDLDIKTIEFGRKKGLNLVGGDLLAYEFDKKPKLIILSHVLEHTVDINVLLYRLSKILDPDGYLFVEDTGIKFHGVPDTLKFLDVEKNFNLDLSSFGRLLKKYGFEVIYGDEYLRFLCTPKQNKVMPKGKEFPFSLNKTKAALLKFAVDIYNGRFKDLYALLKGGEDKRISVRIFNKLQQLYLNYRYALFVNSGKKKWQERK